jgi:arylsulfatase A-like enzyme
MMKKFALAAFCSISLQTGLVAQDQPNIVWLMAENMSTDLECYGMKGIKTPVINKLAKEGVLFTKCYTTSPICSPSRSAMMTGVHQNKINAQHHRSNRDIPLADDVKPFTYWLRQAGYTCVLGNKQIFLNDRKTDCNFKYTPIGAYDGKENFGLFDVKDTLPTNGNPFFVQIQLNSTHRGDWYDSIYYASKDPVLPENVELPSYLPNDPLMRLDWAKYQEMIEYSDYEVGGIVEDLKKRGLYENTIIIYAGDNGRDHLRGIGYLYEAGIHVPMFIHFPKKLAPAVRTDLVSNPDITATVLAFAGIQIPAYMTGKNLFSKDYHRDYIYSTRDLWDEVTEQSRSITELKYKYIRNDYAQQPYDRKQAWLEFVFPGIHVMRKWEIEGKLNEDQLKFMADTKPEEELYDLTKDPYELNNLAVKPEFQAELGRLRKICLEEEKRMTSSATESHLIEPIAPTVIEWVKYTKPDFYAEMLKGKVINFFGIYAEFEKFHQQVQKNKPLIRTF